MAAKLIGSRSDDDHGDDAITDINVTPFVDVVLVLLVIFMITAPALVTKSLGIQLPKSTSSDTGSPPPRVGIVITKLGQILMDGNPIEDSVLIKDIRNRMSLNPDLQALIAADQDSAHRDLVRAIDLLKQGGLQKYALEVKTPEDGTPNDIPSDSGSLQDTQ